LKISEIGSAELVGSSQDAGQFLPRFIDLSSMPAGVDVPVQFRLYLDDGGASNDANDLRLDNLTLYAIVDFTSVVIPEPSALLVWTLLAGLGIGAGWRRKRPAKSDSRGR